MTNSPEEPGRRGEETMIDTKQVHATTLPEIFMDVAEDSRADTHLTLAAGPGDFSEFWDGVVRCGSEFANLENGAEVDVPFFEADALLAWCSDVVGFEVAGRSAIIVLEV